MDNKNTMVKPKNMNIGFGARSLQTELGRNDKGKSSDLAEFFTNAVLFTVTIIKKLLEKIPAAPNVVKSTSLFDSRVLNSEKSELLHREISALLTHLTKLKILSSAHCDKINGQFLEFLDDKLKINVEIFQSFSCDETVLDYFFFKLVSVEKYKDLYFLLKIVLTLSHGQAAAERSFSIGNPLLNYNMSEDSIKAKEDIKDHMLSNGLEPHTIHISNQLIRSVTTARQKYQTFKENSIEEKRSTKINDQKSIVTKELEEVILKRDQLNKVCESLEADIVLAVQSAEKKMDSSFISKANALRKKANETKQDIEKLEETISLLQKDEER